MKKFHAKKTAEWCDLCQAKSVNLCALHIAIAASRTGILDIANADLVRQHVADLVEDWEPGDRPFFEARRELARLIRGPGVRKKAETEDEHYAAAVAAITAAGLVLPEKVPTG